jgi:hypothetical protein
VALHHAEDWAHPAPLAPLARAVGEGITLVGYSLQSAPTGAPVLSGVDPALDLTLYWQVDPDAQPQDWSVSVRPLHGGSLITRADGSSIQQDSAGPVHGLRPFSGLRPHEIIADSYRLPSTTYPDGIQIVLYRQLQDGFENLAVVEWPLAVGR